MQSTIITDSKDSTGSASPDCVNAGGGTFSTGNNNLTDDLSCPGDLSLDATKFNPTLTDNGCLSPGPNGCQRTHALFAGSNALDAAVGGTTHDQRGFPFFNIRDVGAWEDTDRDNDGLTEILEGVGGTDTLDPDTDGDGLNDGDEVLTAGTDPLDKESDDDGVRDGLDPVPAADDKSDDNYGFCEDIADSLPSEVTDEMVVSGSILICADPDGVIVGTNAASKVEVLNGGELRVITPGPTEYRSGGVVVAPGGKLSQYTEELPPPPCCCC